MTRYRLETRPPRCWNLNKMDVIVDVGAGAGAGTDASTPSTPSTVPMASTVFNNKKVSQKPISRATVIALSVVFAIVGITVGVTMCVLYIPRKKPPSQPFIPVLVPTPTVTQAPTTSSILLKSSGGLCVGLSKFNSQLMTLGDCDGKWIVDTTNDILSFDADTYEFCVQYPGAAGVLVYGNSSGCRNVKLIRSDVTATVKALNSSLCITEITNGGLWGDCAGAYSFTVVSLWVTRTMASNQLVPWLEHILSYFE